MSGIHSQLVQGLNKKVLKSVKIQVHLNLLLLIGLNVIFEDALWLHIRAVGEWTNRLYNYFEEQTKLSDVTVEKKPDTFFKMPLMNRKTYEIFYAYPKGPMQWYS
jgi:hypothetical protein